MSWTGGVTTGCRRGLDGLAGGGGHLWGRLGLDGGDRLARRGLACGRGGRRGCPVALLRRGTPHAACGRRELPPSMRLSERTRPSPGAWSRGPCSLLRALSRARRPGPWPLFSFIWPGRLARTVVTWACSSLGAHGLVIIAGRSSTSDPLPAWVGRLSGGQFFARDVLVVPCSATKDRTSSASNGPASRKALANARRLSAASRHPGSGWRYAPRPGRCARGSGERNPSATTTRSRSILSAVTRQPTHVRRGRARSPAGPTTCQSNASLCGTGRIRPPRPGPRPCRPRPSGCRSASR